MNRFISCLVLMALLLVGSSSMSNAVTHVAKKAMPHSKMAGSTACGMSDPSMCGGSCPRSTAGVSASAAVMKAGGSSVKVAKMNSAACPGSDPSKCPSSCQRRGTTAMAARVTGS